MVVDRVTWQVLSYQIRKMPLYLLLIFLYSVYNIGRDSKHNSGKKFLCALYVEILCQLKYLYIFIMLE